MTKTRLAVAAVFGVACGAAWHSTEKAQESTARIRQPVGKEQADNQLSDHATLARKHMPAIVRVKSQSLVEDDPTKANYDPTKLLLVLDMPIGEIHESEPRDSLWASEMEVALERYVTDSTKQDFPNSELVSVECRSASCKTHLTVPDDEFSDLNEYVQVFAVMGEYMSVERSPIDEEGRRTLTVSTIFGPTTRSSADLLRLQSVISERKKEDLEKWRELHQVENQ